MLFTVKSRLEPSEGWLECIVRWMRFRTISKLDKEEDILQIDCLLFIMGPRSESIFSSLGLETAQIGVYASVKKGSDEYYFCSVVLCDI